MPAEPIERDRYAHTRDVAFAAQLGHVHHLCEVALRPSSIDNYAAEKLDQAAEALARARAILHANMGGSHCADCGAPTVAGGSHDCPDPWYRR